MPPAPKGWQDGISGAPALYPRQLLCPQVPPAVCLPPSSTAVCQPTLHTAGLFGTYLASTFMTATLLLYCVLARGGLHPADKGTEQDYAA